MLNFLFWNINRKPLLRSVANLVRRHDVSVLILAECDYPHADVVKEVNNQAADNQGAFGVSTPFSACPRLVVAVREPHRVSKILRESADYSISTLESADFADLTLAAVHFPSKLYRSEQSQSLELVLFSTGLREVENSQGHTRSLVIGDFNMNPFEFGMVAATGLNAVMTRQTASQEFRTHQGVRYPFLYNPMWSHFGDSTHQVYPPGHEAHEPAGTCYYSAADSCWYYWNIFDQVLLRPALLSMFRNETLKVLVDDGEASFLSTSGRPNRKSYSDHLPILFALSDQRGNDDQSVAR